MKKANGAIAIFVETPILNKTKPLISPLLGPEVTLELYDFCCQATTSIVRLANDELVASGLPGLDIYWAPQDANDVKNGFWQDFPVVNQGQGEQPERIFTVYDTLLKQHPFVIMIYADTPQITSQLFVKIALLYSQPDKAKDFIIGPVDYGGYYLFAGRKEVPLYVWKSVSYTDSNAINALASNLLQTASVAWIEMMPSLDGIRDVERIRIQLTQASNLTPEQIRLRVFLTRVLKAQKN